MTEIPSQIGRYHILSILGQGGMGIVFRALHPEKNRVVAIKTVFISDKRQTEMIRREIMTLSRINHPGIVKILEEGVQNERPWYAMELIDGITLDQFNADMLWTGTGYTPRWTSESSDVSLQNSDMNSPSRWWTKILGTTLDIATIKEVFPEINKQKIKKPKRNNRDRFPAAGGHLDMVYALGQRICASLAYLHGEGFVHRDLKPSNILINNSGIPILMDFGLMFQFWGKISREALNDFDRSGGTLMYVAPEQILGKSVDARADLYALGCILYELVTGQMPFEVHSIAQAIHAHLEFIPVKPSLLVDDVPSQLDDLIMNLLEKRPSDRIGSAVDVARILADLGGTDPWTESCPDPKPYLYRPSCIGRRTPIKKVISFLNRISQRRQGAIIVIEGECGAGKTRFLIECGKQSSHRKLIRFYGECSPATPDLDHKIPFKALYNVIEEIIEKYCSVKKDSYNDTQFKTNLKILKNYFPVLKRYLSEDNSCLPELSNSSSIFRLFEALTRIIEKITVLKPTVLLLDDIQYADDFTLQWIAFLQRTGTLNKTPLLIICTLRPDQKSALLETVLKRKDVFKIQLPFLNMEETKMLIEEMLAQPDIPKAFSKSIWAATEGNPFFISEYLRNCLNSGELYRDSKGRWQISEKLIEIYNHEKISQLSVPVSLQTLLKKRIETLSESARKVALAIAVLGREIDISFLWQIIPFNEEMITALDDLIMNQIIEESDSGRLRFVHSIMHRYIYENVFSEIRSEFHRSAALLYESFDVMTIHDRAAELTRHWEGAGETKQAAQYALLAARAARKQYDFKSAGIFYRKYFSYQNQVTSDWIQAMNEYATSILTAEGSLTEALKTHKRALEEARKLCSVSDQIQSLTSIILVLGRMGRFKELPAYLEESLRLSQSSGDLSGEAIALTNYGCLLVNRAMFDSAENYLKKALEIFKKINDRSGVAYVYSVLATIYLSRDQLTSAEKFFIKSFNIHHDIKEFDRESDDLKDLSILYWMMNRLDDALNKSYEALKIVRRIKDKYRESLVITNLALIHHDKGDLKVAEIYYKEALKINREVENKFGEGVTLSNYAHVLYDLELIDEAIDTLKKSLEILESVGSSQYCMRIMQTLAMFYRQYFGDIEKAEYWLDRAENMNRALNDPLISAGCMCERGHIALYKGEDPASYLIEINKSLEHLKNQIDKELNTIIKRFEIALKDFHANIDLIHGESTKTIPGFVLRSISKNN